MVTLSSCSPISTWFCVGLCLAQPLVSLHTSPGHCCGPDRFLPLVIPGQCTRNLAPRPKQTDFRDTYSTGMRCQAAQMWHIGDAESIAGVGRESNSTHEVQEWGKGSLPAPGLYLRKQVQPRCQIQQGFTHQV